MLYRYRVESADGAELFSCADPQEAREHAAGLRARVVEEQYEYSDSELVWDFSDEPCGTCDECLAGIRCREIPAAEEAD